MKFYLVLFTSLWLALICNAQITADTTSKTTPSGTAFLSTTNGVAQPKKTCFAKPYIIPAVLITYGVVTLNSAGLKNFNEQVKEEIWTNHPHPPKHIDNYLQFVPAAAVYTLNALGIKGKNNFKNRTILYLLSNGIMNIVVSSTKKISHQIRPNGIGYSSFPSGHTAEAFASAEFLRMEYKEVSPWYGVAGYAVAATTGYLRMYNNKHWLNDVLAGAGVGIASTQFAYWLYPKMQKLLCKHTTSSNTLLLPTYQNHSVGLVFVHSF
jgi:hypothetical protein